MRRHFQLPMAVIAGALLGLIALLATLQYRWLGQISGAERERMTATLNSRAKAFAEDVDREITRAYLLFQLDPMQQEEPSLVAGLAARYDRWQATARFPRMIKDVYVVASQQGDAALPMQHFNTTTRFLEPAAWPDALADVHAALDRAGAAMSNPASTSTSTATVVLRPSVQTVWSAIPALVVAAPMLMVSHIQSQLDARPGAAGLPLHMASGARYSIVVLDGDYLRNDMLPALAQQHFRGTGDGFDYQLAVVPASGTQAAVYHSVGEFTPAPDARVDARVDLFQVRPKDFEPLVTEVTRFTTFVAMPHDSRAGQRTQTFVRSMTTEPQSNMTIGSPLSIVLQGSAAAATTQQRVGALLSGATAGFSARVTTPAPGQWRLLVKHPSGSLERAVNTARLRNLAISTSVLGILGISVGFLVVSTRRAHDLARQQLEFVATVSHELRTPLAVIRSAADNLADGVVNDEARVRQYGQLVRGEGLRLTDLVEQILEFAGLQSGQRTLTPRPVEIATVLRDVAATAESTAPAGIQIELSATENLPAVAGDEAALRRAFQNLVGNAIKYGADRRWIGIRAAAVGSTVEVSVSDRGIGIAPADQARIFDPFYRAPEVVSAQIQGAGLGLSLVKRIVEAHGGRITVTSTPGAGSTFIVSLPVASGDTTAMPSGIADAAAQPS
jgi:two-component system sensor histidine kinase SenX3